MGVRISKSDMVWSYVALFFNMGSGLITLPVILHMLSTEEIAMNYLMMTIGSMVAMVDFGFSPQFARNFTYVFSGATELKEEGVSENVQSGINYHLLRCLIDCAKTIFRYMSLIVLILMLTAGTWYISAITDGFTNIENSLLIWIVYSLSVYLNIYFCYYSSLLTGRGMIKEAKKAGMFSRIVYILLTYSLLLAGFGLLGVCIANLISPFISRWISYRCFYDAQIKEALSGEKSSGEEVRNLFHILWYNAKKLGITTVGTYAALKFSLFISGLYLTMEDVSSFGLLMQLANYIVMISTTFNSTLIPELTSYKVNNNQDGLIKRFSWALNVFQVSFICLSAGLVLLGPALLHLIGSNADLPSRLIVVLYLLILFLENNHSLFATFITVGNSVPFAKVSIISGTLICIGDFLILKYTGLGLLGLVLVQGIVQLAYNNWYWPYKVCKDLNLSYITLSVIGQKESLEKVRDFKAKILSA